MCCTGKSKDCADDGPAEVSLSTGSALRRILSAQKQALFQWLRHKIVASNARLLLLQFSQ